MRTDRRIDVYLILIAPAVIFLFAGLSDLAGSGSSALGILLVVAGLAVGAVAIVGLRRTVRGSRRLPPPSPTHKTKKSHHKGTR